LLNRTLTGLLLIVLAAGLAGCDGTNPTSPTPLAQQIIPPPAARRSGSSYGEGYTLTGVTLSGIVFEPTPTGQVPVADVTVYCDACGEVGHTWMRTDANGYYSFTGDVDAGGGIWLSRNPTPLWVGKEGYQDPQGPPPRSTTLPSGPGWREVRITGDTRFDIELARQ
jgi:hypothetical protein